MNNQEDKFQVKVAVVPNSESGDAVSALYPEEFTVGEIQKITEIISLTTNEISDNYNDPQITNKFLKLSKIEFSFGVDFEVETKIPVLTPIIGVGGKAGSTFRVTLTLSRD